MFEENPSVVVISKFDLFSSDKLFCYVYLDSDSQASSPLNSFFLYINIHYFAQVTSYAPPYFSSFAFEGEVENLDLERRPDEVDIFRHCIAIEVLEQNQILFVAPRGHVKHFLLVSLVSELNQE